MNYENAVKLLTSQKRFRINPGLERVLKVLELLNNPHEKLKVIHVAGTNGKGSVCAILSNILMKAGYKTGLYTSPHLVNYTERIKINNRQISKDDFADYINTVTSLADENNTDLTEFEILTICAIKYFCDNKTDIAVIETGLGGRLDATNVFPMPVVEIITSVSKDHTDRLGSSIEQIAYEKSGIIKENSNVIISCDNAGFKTAEQNAVRKHARLIAADCNNIKLTYVNGQNFVYFGGKKYEFNLLGLYQRENLSLVFKTVNYLRDSEYKISENDVREGLKSIKWGARLEYIKEKNLIADGAHNPDAAFKLKQSLDYYFPDTRRVYIYSTLNTKDYKKISEILFNKDDEIFYYEFNHNNAVKYEEYVKNTELKCKIEKLEPESLKAVLKRPELKVVTGSLYMIGALYNELIDDAF